MKHLFLFILLVVGYSAAAQSVKALDEKNGFRDAVFGTDFSAMPGLVVTEGAGTDTQVATRSTDELRVGNAELSSISYFFYKGKLYTVMLETKGLVNSRGLLDALRASYGRGWQHNQFMEEFDWTGRTTRMSYSENSITNDAMVFITSKPISAQKAADEKTAAQKAKSDL